MPLQRNLYSDPMCEITKNPTLFVDIDGTIIKYRNFNELGDYLSAEPIQDVIDFINDHYDSGSVIIITTARPSDYEILTKQELEKVGIKYHQIVMNCGRGTRVVLNDIDPKSPEIKRAIGLNLQRNGGILDIEIPSDISPYISK